VGRSPLRHGALGFYMSSLEDGTMRTMQWLVGLAAAGALSGLFVAGCGDDTAATPPPSDAGPADHTTPMPEAAPMETGMGTDAPSGDDSAVDGGMEACVPDADLATVMLPDAAIGDSSATVPECFACIATQCPTELAACSGDCTCSAVAQTFIACISSGMPAYTCGAALLGNAGADPAATALANCVGGPITGADAGPGCLAQCGIGGGGGEGGTEGGTEAGPTEGGSEGGSEGGATEGGPTEAGGDATGE
jgi:hypothetical protein